MTEDQNTADQPNPQLAFNAFGRLFAKVAAFEQFMRVVVTKHEIQSGTYTELGEAERRAKSDKLLRMDFAKLEQRISNAFCSTEDDRAILKDARDFRNYLAHNFWQNHFGFLHSNRGIFLIEQSCAQYEIQFHATERHLIELTGIDMVDYVEWVRQQPTSSEHLDEYERLIGEGWQAHLDAGHVWL